MVLMRTGIAEAGTAIAVAEKIGMQDMEETEPRRVESSNGPTKDRDGGNWNSNSSGRENWNAGYGRSRAKESESGGRLPYKHSRNRSTVWKIFRGGNSRVKYFQGNDE